MVCSSSSTVVLHCSCACAAQAACLFLPGWTRTLYNTDLQILSSLQLNKNTAVYSS